MDDVSPVLIVGAGIAGLTTALALAGRGIRSVVLERAGHLEEVGAGLQLSPNASRILLGLGLGPDLERSVVRPDALVIREARRGDEIGRLPLGSAIDTAYGSPYWVVHRGDLQSALLSATAREPKIELHLGSVVESAVDGPDGVAVDAVIGATVGRFQGAALIGADGVWSTVRTRLIGGGPAIYSGRTAWRATFPAERWTGSADVRRSTGLWLGSDAHLVHYPIRAGREINLVAAVDDHWIDERWDVAGDSGDLLARFEGWPSVVGELLALPDAWRKWALCGAPRGTVWNKGRIVLIGDAAHGMLPFAAQGGAMAIEDAAVLARCLATGRGSMERRLTDYVRRRRRRVDAVVSMASRNATIYHLSGAAASARNLAMRLMGSAGLRSRMDWIYGWTDREHST